MFTSFILSETHHFTSWYNTVLYVCIYVIYYHLPRLYPWVPDGSRYRECHPWGQTAPEICGYEGGGTPRDLPGRAQGIRCPGQVQVTGHPGGIWSGDQGPQPPLQVLLAASDGGVGRKLLRITLPRRERRDTGETMDRVMVGDNILHIYVHIKLCQR